MRPRRKDKWKAKNKARFFLNVGRLLQRGYTLNHGAKLLMYGEPPHARNTISSWIATLQDGRAWVESLELLKIPSDISAYLYFSERYGMLSHGFYYAGRMLEQRERFKEKVRTLARYPILLIWIIATLFLFMTLFVFPQFEELFATMDIDYPAITSFTFTLFEGLPFAFGAFIVVTVGFYAYYQQRFKKLHSFQQIRTVEKIPGSKRWLHLYITYTVSLQMSQLLKGGLSAHDALQVFIKQRQMPFLQAEGERIQTDLNEGKSLHDAIAGASYYQQEFADVIRHGQAAGQLAEDLAHYSEMLWEELNERTRKTTVMIQPFLFLVIGGFILLLFLSIFLPIFQLITSLDG
ncbi:competence type IV pilus assembly protein ComGB [Natribacillus halophilus]|uniref:Competence-related pilin export protein ComGB n=1 Tax=Natribacillus halophilus TaxID=549003 RepID=A0A1G8JMC6_9BACI|nr:competence type IV pilus assembly protein ComGB [Natribacillus halophilus]SDI32449.1 competence-related pilin export protein ComGB [Natribacillus halophilus]